MRTSRISIHHGLGLAIGLLIAGTSHALTLDEWVARVWPEIKTGPALQARVLERDAAAKAMKAARLEDPWTVSVTPSRMDERPRALGDETQAKTQYNLANEVRYANLSGLEASLKESTSSVRTKNDFVLEDTGPARDDTYILSHQVSGRVSYDVWNGAANSPRHLQSLAESADAEAQLYSAEATLLSFELDAYATLIDVFFSKCSADAIRPALDVVAQTVQRGLMQQKANIISYKDYLNFLNLKVNVEQRLISSQTALRKSLDQLRGSGKAFTTAQEALKESFVCDFPADALVASVKATLGQTTEGSFQRPQIKAQEASVKAAQLRLRAVDASRAMSLGPFVAGDWTPKVDRSAEAGTVTLGVTWTWTLPSGRSPAEYAAQKERLLASQANLAAAKDQARAKLASLASDFDSQRELLPSTDSLIANSAEIIAATKSQLMTGSVDSLQYSTSYLSRVDALNARSAILSSLVKLRYEIDAGRTGADPLSR